LVSLAGYLTINGLLAAGVGLVAGRLRNGGEQLRLALDSAEMALLDWDLARDRVVAAGRWNEVLRIDPGTLGGDVQAWRARIHHDDLPAHDAALRAHLRGACPAYAAQMRLRDDSGAWVWVECRGRAVARRRDGRVRRLVIAACNIDAQRRHEEGLAASGRRFRQIFETNQAIKLIIDPASGCIEDANQAACRFYGYPHGELTRKRISDLNVLPPEQVAAEMARAAREDRLYFQFRHRLANGEQRDVEVYSGPVESDQGPRLYSIVHDITERRATEGALAEAQARYRSVTDGLREVIFQVDSSLRWTFLNAAWVRLTGRAVTQSVGQPLVERFDAADRHALQTGLGAVLAGDEEAWSGTARLYAGDGSLRLVELVARAQTDAGGTVVGLAGTLRDVQDEHDAQTRLRLMADVFTHSNEGIVITDARARIIEVNQAFVRITGYSREEVLGHTPALLKSGHQSSDFYATLWGDLREHGTWQGEIWNRRKDGGVYPELLTISAVREPDGSVLHYVGVFADISQLKQHERELEQIAHYDALTHLPNRVLLADRMKVAIAQAKRSGALLAVVYLDLDGFKEINDRYGHAGGDRLLIEVGQRLAACVREGDTVARLGGDEFVLLLGDLKGVEECEVVLQRVLRWVGQPANVGPAQCAVSVSAGIAIFPSDDGDGDTLLRHADQAMYVAKQGGRNRYHLFDPENDRRARTHRARLQRIEQALHTGEFRLYYQPKVNMRSGEVLGMEALLRWDHPEEGVLPPGEFLSQLRDSGLDVELGYWVVGEALRQIGEWGALGLRLPVSVNVSGPLLECAEFIPTVRARLAAQPAARGLLEFEVLETSAIGDIQRVSDVIQACRRMDVRFSLDDFGTGYSPLGYLRQLPADELKIDKSFVIGMLDDPADRAIVEGTIGLARAFQRGVIAEGVESFEHGLMLLELGCDAAQGYAIARPMPADDVPTWLEDWRDHPLWEGATTFRWSRADIPLLAAEQAHRAWVRQMDGWLAGNAALPELDPHRCRFGRWFADAGKARYGRSAEYARIAELHERIHTLGAAAGTAAADGDRARAERLVAEVHDVHEELSPLIQELLLGVSLTA
jgi:diguanylate cyclase (GGDEF)-like protein/PAS domain S-box-containing protein